MLKDELFKLVGENVIVILKNGQKRSGILGYTYEFSEKFDYRKPGYFTVCDYDFKVSHIRSIIVVK